MQNRGNLLPAVDIGTCDVSATREKNQNPMKAQTETRRCKENLRSWRKQGLKSEEEKLSTVSDSVDARRETNAEKEEEEEEAIVPDLHQANERG
ncbi:hypothetical protein ACLOJK_041768 [Asimina triloba]